MPLSKLLLLFCLKIFFLIPSLKAQAIINEFMSSNDQTLLDDDGNSSDWIEIYNTSGEAINMNGYFLSDEEEDLHKWAFPSVIIPPYNYLLVYCSSEDRAIAGMPLHTNFKLSAGGEDLFLVNENEIQQYLPPIALDEDIAFAAFLNNGQTVFLNTDLATPGKANLLDAGVDFSVPAGFYSDSIDVVLSFDSPLLTELQIRYTLDGSEPTSDDFLVENKLVIKDRSEEDNILANIPSTPNFSNWEGENYYPAWKAPSDKLAKANVIRAAAFLGTQRISQVVTHSYFVFDEGNDRYDFPVVSLSCSPDSLFSNNRGIYVPGDSLNEDNLVWSGNYFNKGSSWERELSFEYFVEGESVVNQAVGLRVHGGKTRGAAQKTMRLYARSSYGESRFEYPFFSQKDQSSYKRLLLRSTMGAWTNTIIADAYVHQAAKSLHLDIQEYQPVIVFINGEYWGIHDLREHFDQHKIADDYELDKDSITVYASYGDVIEGEEDTEFIYIRDQYLSQNDITEPEVYAHIKQRFDIDHLIDYHLTEIFFSNPDWPDNNAKMWRSKQYDNKFRWLFYDVDGGMGEDNIDDDILLDLLEQENYRGAASWANALIRTLIKNEEFKQQFIIRAMYLLQEPFHPDTLYNLAKEIEIQYVAEVEEHFRRWENWLTKDIWQNNINLEIKKNVSLRACEMEQQMIDYFGVASFLDCSKEDVEGILIYPNPSDGLLNIFLDNHKEGIYHCSIYNNLGQLVEDHILTFSSLGETLDISHLANGVYHLCLFDVRMERIGTESIILF